MAPVTLLRRTAGHWLSDGAQAWCRLRMGQRPVPAEAAAASPGSTLVASFFARRNGVAFGAQMQVAALRRLGVEAVAVDATAGIRNPFRRAAAAPAAVAIVHSDGRMVGLVLNHLGRAAASAYRIGYCAWELASPPRDWAGFDRVLHEVWSPSRFSAGSLQPICGVPVRVVPHVIDPVPGGGASMRTRLGIGPHPFVVLTMADLRSSLARKNPFAAIEAFRCAFGANPDATLVLKVSGADHDAGARQRLQQALRGVRAVVIDTPLSSPDQWALLDACDVLVSLHRAEGYGLPMAEAMALGKPVVATGWSGNLDFMEPDNAALVDHRLVEIDDPQGVYRDGVWAEPDLDGARRALLRIFDDTGYRRALGRAAALRFAPQRQIAALRAAFSTQVLSRMGLQGEHDGR